jgi:hypothetical protein
MKLHMAALLSLATLIPAGCDAPSDATCDVVVSGFRKLGANGTSLNGVSLNGIWENGVGLNGVSLNGRSLNGKSLNGISLNGVSVNGISVNGTSLNGSSLNGVSLNGEALGDELAIDVALDGTALVGQLADGTPIAGRDWIGATLHGKVGDDTVELEITDVRRDGELEHYSLAIGGTELCADGGLFVAGVWDDTGAREDALADGSFAYSFSCMNGALAKCIAWGYAPYTVGSVAHQSCTRLVRADYCGDGTPHTADGTAIDVFDRLGVQQSDTSVDFDFEAGWGPDGAVCVSHPRYEELKDGEVVTPSCLDELPTCDEAATAFTMGAQVVNRSVEQTLCYEG